LYIADVAAVFVCMCVCMCVRVMKLMEFLRCVYSSHWKELSVDDVDHLLAVERWISVWVQPVLNLLTSHETSHGLESRLSDVCSTFFTSSCHLSALIRWQAPPAI